MSLSNMLLETRYVLLCHDNIIFFPVLRRLSYQYSYIISSHQNTHPQYYLLFCVMIFVLFFCVCADVQEIFQA